MNDNSPSARAGSPAYLNPDLPVQERVEDLLFRMSLEEKISQMLYTVSLGRESPPFSPRQLAWPLPLTQN